MKWNKEELEEFLHTAELFSFEVIRAASETDFYYYARHQSRLGSRYGSIFATLDDGLANRLNGILPGDNRLVVIWETEDDILIHASGELFQ